jgi:serine/threonine-protein kinase
VLDEQGACDEEETMARQLAAASPEQAVSQHLLARSLAAKGKSEAAVHEALRLRWAALPAFERKRLEPEETLALQLFTGDFVSAERTAREMEAAAEPSRREADHGRASRHLTNIYLETGRNADAGREAAAFFGRRDAWEPDARAEDYALADNAVPPLLRAWREAGGLSRADLAAKRASWVNGWKQKAPAFYRPYVWVHGFAGLVETEADAREALAELPGYQPLPSFLPFTMGEAAVGHVYLLAGAVDEAIAWLERGTKTCRALDLPVEHTRALLWLGMAREAKHDKEGACSAYKAVLSRWGKPKPKSVTAEKAGERARALSCGG